MNCPNCQGEILKESELWRFCRYCGTNLHETLLGCTGCGWLLPSDDNDDPNNNYCGYCGGKIGVEVNFKPVDADFKVISNQKL